MSKTRYYFISYSHERGFGSCFITSRGDLDIIAAQNEIHKSNENLGKTIIISIMPISKSQYIKALTTDTSHLERDLSIS